MSKKYIETDRTFALKNHGNQCKTVVQMLETVLSFQGFSWLGRTRKTAQQKIGEKRGVGSRRNGHLFATRTMTLSLAVFRATPSLNRLEITSNTYALDSLFHRCYHHSHFPGRI